ncbi:Zn(II)2Cys6 transcription factor [Aspergillus coremiiformis]|uniref:Zn(II)2Cys6 transcription factor n=1 Tax=Aspergillus coremiiformis TaxID=138285 RepID=A0A5N6Z4L8_9EURO|nr:Zn(II)2Cys6 transcription factor [Aspergillus coremiiformis]
MRRVKKSRNGCARCKSKRVKCGEEKPHCSRCRRLGVNCPGYVQSLRWVTKYHNDNNDQPSEPLVGGPSTVSPQRLQCPDTSVQSSDATPIATAATAATYDTPEPKGLDLDDNSALGDGLWGLAEPDSLLELADLGPSPGSTLSSAVEPERNSSIFSLEEHPSNLFPTRAPEPQHEVPNFFGFSPSTFVREYLPPNSRPPQHDLMSIPQPLNNPSWTLIEYYFKEVAALFSSYDSQMNPFRSTVSRLWGSSLAMCKTMQSMAAATLVNDFPQFGPLGRKLRNEAVETIAKETTLDDKSLLALLMLGQTASWHDPKDLGISFFNLLRNHLDTEPLEATSLDRVNNHQFFQEALIYWEMLLSFVADDTIVLSGSAATERRGLLVLQKIPHPWTGIARDTQFTVQEVGRLVRRERKRIRSRFFTSRADIAQAQKAIEKARELEERLLGLAHPAEAEIINPGDDETPVWHLLTMAEVYRCTGLLQLYRVFPDLLRRRLPGQPPSSQPSNQPPTASPRDLFLSVDTADLLDSAWVEPTYLQPESNELRNDSETLPDSYYDRWLAEFALTTLSRLKTIPVESRTRCLQPFLLVASSSELRLPRPEPSLDNDGLNISSYAIEVSRMRRFVLGRLTSFLHVLPPKPIDVCLQLVKDVWRRMDAEEPNVHWIDVMLEKGWETTMG